MFMALDPKQVAKSRPFPPLATLYAASLLRARGYRVAVFDAMLAADEDAFAEALAAHPPRLVVLFEDNFNFLSKMCLGRMREAALAMIAMARAPGLPVFAAGSDATDDPGAYLDAGAAAVLAGEADHTLVEVAGVVLGSAGGGDWLRALARIPGLVLRGSPPPGKVPPDKGTPGKALPDKGASAGVTLGQPMPGHANGHLHAAGTTPGALIRTPPRAPERKPDVFPWPARDLVDVEGYRRRWTAAHGYFMLNMVSTRGCPFHCNWCAKPIWGQRYAMRSAADVAAELAEVKRAFAPDRVWFADDIFGLRPDWVVELGAEVEARGARIPFQIQSRVDLVSDAAADGLARAGCDEVWLGVESGSQRVLDAMEKGIRVEDVPPAVARLRSRGIRVCFFLQFGYPGETWDDIRATVALVQDIVPDDIGISVSYPLPGTRFHTMVASALGDKRHWTDSRDLAMLFRGTYSSEFYRALHAALHLDLAARHAASRGGRRDEVVEGMKAEVRSSETSRSATARVEAEGTDMRPADVVEPPRAVAAAWAEVERLERTCRMAAPTTVTLPAAGERPAPDLSRLAN